MITIATQDSKVYFLQYFKYKRDISPGNHGKCFPDLRMKMVSLAFLPSGISEQSYKMTIQIRKYYPSAHISCCKI